MTLWFLRRLCRVLEKSRSTSTTEGGLCSNILGPAKTIPMAPMGEVMRIPSTAMVRIYILNV